MASMSSGSDEEPTSGGTPSYDARRVPAYQSSAQPDGTRIMESAPPDTSPRPPTSAGVRALDPSEAPPSPKSSTELAARSQKERRRERDARAEKAATRTLIGLFLGLGALALVVVNSGWLDGDTPPPRSPAELAAAAKAAAAASASASPSRAPALRSRPDETPDLPAIAALSSTGLTIAAEGLPEVLAVEPDNPPPLLAGIETCRFAYAIWELSPNRAFRFFTTCAVFQGQVMVGAYEVQGSQIVMSPLRADGAELVSVFEVEKPSRMRTQVTIQPRADGPRAIFDVRQRITAMRPGLDGEGFFRAYQGKNNVEVAGVAASRGGPSAPAPRVGSGAPPRGEAPRDAPREEEPSDKPAAEKDPVLELLQGGQ
jgi:hypothetical protein